MFWESATGTQQHEIRRYNSVFIVKQLYNQVND
jgi:hypothetical protein